MSPQNIPAISQGLVPLSRERSADQNPHNASDDQDDDEVPREEAKADPGPKLGLVVDRLV